MKKRVITMILLSIICISACSSAKKPEKQTEPKAYVVEKPVEKSAEQSVDQPAEEDLPEPYETTNAASYQGRTGSLTEDWPDWFAEPTDAPEDEEVKQALQGKLDSLPKWMQVTAVRPRSVVAWLEMLRLITPANSAGKDVTSFLKQNPEYILSIITRLNVVFEKAENGEWSDMNNPPQEFIELEQIVAEILAQLE